MEATGHYWQNMFAALATAGFAVALLNPIRTHNFAKEEMAIDALGIAHFAQQKRPVAGSTVCGHATRVKEYPRFRDCHLISAAAYYQLMRRPV